MKKRLFSLLLCLLIAVSLATPAFAAHEYGKYYDETEELWTQGLQSMGEDTLASLSSALNFDIRLDVFTSLGDGGIVATAEYVFENYYGADTDDNGVSLSIYVLEDSTGWAMEQWYIHLADNTGKWEGLDDYLYDYVIDGFTFAAWEDDLAHDCKNVELISGLLAAGVTQFALDNGIPMGGAASNNTPSVTPAPETDPAPVDTDPVLGFGADGNVVDMMGVLTAEQDAALEEIIASIANPYQCGCYIVVTDNLYEYGEDGPNAVINLYHGNNLGVGETRDGILLLLDPVNRKFAFFVYGKNAEYIFNAYGQEQLEQVFLDDFQIDGWYDGLEDFALECGKYMELAAQGNPVSQNKSGYYALAVLAGLLVAGIVCFVLVAQMKSVYKGTEAAEYVTAGGLMLTERSDIFMYKTTTTRDLSSDDDDSSSSSSFSGGGGSGRSGSF